MTKAKSTEAKGRALPATRTPKVGKNPANITKRTAVPGSAQAEATGRVEAARLAQIVNLHIAGYSLAEIGESIGMTAAEVDRILNQDVARYVRSQPALRVFVRNFISEKYLGLLESSYPQATDKGHEKQLEYYDRVLRTLQQMGRLHGAEVPSQSEVKVDAAPELVQAMVDSIAEKQGLAYDLDVFDDIEEADIVEAHEEAKAALADASEMVGEGDDEDL